jgi:hypothetical protein
MLTSGCPSINTPVLLMLLTRFQQVVQWWPQISQNILPGFLWLTFHTLCEASNALVWRYWHHTQRNLLQACYHCCNTATHFFLFWPISTLSQTVLKLPHSHTLTLITTNYTTGATFPHLLLPSVCKTDYSQPTEDDSKSRYCHVKKTAKAWNDNPHL